MFSRKLLTMLVAVFFLTATSLAHAGKPSDKPPPSEDVEDAIKELQAMTRAFHGYKVLRAEFGGAGGRSGEAEYTKQVLIAFCPEGSFGAGTSYVFCDDDVPEAYVLNTAVIYPDVFDLVVTFDRNNTADFDGIVEQLTNGNRADGLAVYLCISQVGSPTCGGGGRYGTEYGYLDLYNPIAPIAGRVDWVGLDIGSISVKINAFFVEYDAIEDRTEYFYDYEVFFETPID